MLLSLHLVVVNSKLHPAIKGSYIQFQSTHAYSDNVKVNSFPDEMVVSSFMWKQTEDILKWKKNILFVLFFIVG